MTRNTKIWACGEAFCVLLGLSAVIAAALDHQYPLAAFLLALTGLPAYATYMIIRDGRKATR